MNNLLGEMITIAHTVGNIMLNAQQDHLDVTTKKHDGDFVTKFDYLIQNKIVDHLALKFPDAEFLGEENNLIAKDPNALTFIIDPIDGTANFVKNIRYSSTSIAAMFHGEIIAGVVFDPYKNELFTAEKNQGAFLNQEKQLFVTPKPLNQSIACFGTAMGFAESKQFTKDLLNILLDTCLDIRRFGTASLDCCSIALGRLDCYCEPRLHPWDYAAAALILEEAGGLASTIFNTPLSLSHASSTLFGNPLAHADLLKLLKKIKRPLEPHSTDPSINL